MSAWSSTTGKTTYAERLRLASQSSTAPAPGRNTNASSSSRPAAQSAEPTANGVKSSSSPTVPSTLSSPPPNNASPSPSTHTATSAGPSSASSPAKPSVNVWEARKKQLADKEAANPKDSLPTSNGSIVPGASANGIKEHSSSTVSVTRSGADRTSERSTSLADTGRTGQTSSPASHSTRAESAGRPSANSQATGEAARSHSASAAVRDSRLTSPTSIKSAAESSRHPSADANTAALSPNHASKPAAHFSPQPLAGSTTSDEKPSNAAAVASTIEEAMKQGNATGTETEDGDAWLARIHLLNGGQNMPKFGGFGPNGALSAASGSPLGGHGTEDEAQAAKKAERAVADAWGAGKNVWQKNQQQRQEQASPALVTSPPTQNTTATPATAQSELPRTEGAGESVTKDSSKPATSEKPAGKKGHAKEGSSRKNQQAAAPSFEDVSKWPAPVEAVKKSADKAKSPTLSADAAQPSTSPLGEKSIYETLSELQLEVAPGAAPHGAPGNVANGRKGKQWISIVPNITHTSSNQKQQPRSGDAKTRGNNKQAKKEKAGQRQARSPHGAKKEEAGGSAAPGGPEVGPTSAAAPVEQTQGGLEPAATHSRNTESPSVPLSNSSAPHTRDGSPAKQAPHLSRNSSGQGSRTYSPIPTTPSGTPRTNGAQSGPHTYTSPRASMSYPMPPAFAPRAGGGMSPSHGYHPNNGAYPVPAGRGAGWAPFVPYARPPLPPQMLEQTSQTGVPIPSGTPGQLLGQIEFYFSQRNLEGDFFLRQKMDGQGWVDISVVAAFKRVQNITRDLRLIEDALLHSAVLDVDTERKKVRRRYGWEMFVLPEGGVALSSMQHSVEAQGSTGASATPTASRGSTGLASPPSSFSRSSEDVSDVNGQDDDDEGNRGKDQGGDDDDQILGIVASSGLGGTLDKQSSTR